VVVKMKTWFIPLHAIVAAVTLTACAEDPGEWRPRDASKVYPPERTAFRIHSASELADCAERIGVVHVNLPPSEAVEGIAKTAAAHGGTHYIIRGDRTSEELVTESHGSAFVVGQAVLTNERSHSYVEATGRQAWAVIYRDCK
jgi:hypothetical protein